jgi:hypothetical protein
MAGDLTDEIHKRVALEKRRREMTVHYYQQFSFWREGLRWGWCGEG